MTQTAERFPYSPFTWDEERRAILRAELDGLYAHLYTLTRDELKPGHPRPVATNDDRRFVRLGVPERLRVDGDVRLVVLKKTLPRGYLTEDPTQRHESRERMRAPA